MTDQQEHYAEILRVLDGRVKAAAESRGLKACDGRSVDQECELGDHADVHGSAAGLALAIARMIDEPVLTMAEQIAAVEKLEDFRRTLKKAFAGKPRLS